VVENSTIRMVRAVQFLTAGLALWALTTCDAKKAEAAVDTKVKSSVDMIAEDLTQAYTEKVDVMKLISILEAKMGHAARVNEAGESSDEATENDGVVMATVDEHGDVVTQTAGTTGGEVEVGCAGKYPESACVAFGCKYKKGKTSCLNDRWNGKIGYQEHCGPCGMVQGYMETVKVDGKYKKVLVPGTPLKEGTGNADLIAVIQKKEEFEKKIAVIQKKALEKK